MKKIGVGVIEYAKNLSKNGQKTLRYVKSWKSVLAFLLLTMATNNIDAKNIDITGVKAAPDHADIAETIRKIQANDLRDTEEEVYMGMMGNQLNSQLKTVSAEHGSNDALLHKVHHDGKESVQIDPILTAFLQNTFAGKNKDGYNTLLNLLGVESFDANALNGFVENLAKKLQGEFKDVSGERRKRNKKDMKAAIYSYPGIQDAVKLAHKQALDLASVDFFDGLLLLESIYPMITIIEETGASSDIDQKAIRERLDVYADAQGISEEERKAGRRFEENISNSDASVDEQHPYGTNTDGNTNYTNTPPGSPTNTGRIDGHTDTDDNGNSATYGGNVNGGSANDGGSNTGGTGTSNGGSGSSTTTTYTPPPRPTYAGPKRVPDKRRSVLGLGARAGNPEDDPFATTQAEDNDYQNLVDKRAAELREKYAKSTSANSRTAYESTYSDETSGVDLSNQGSSQIGEPNNPYGGDNKVTGGNDKPIEESAGENNQDTPYTNQDPSTPVAVEDLDIHNNGTGKDNATGEGPNNQQTGENGQSVSEIKDVSTQIAPISYLSMEEPENVGYTVLQTPEDWNNNVDIAVARGDKVVIYYTADLCIPCAKTTGIEPIENPREQDVAAENMRKSPLSKVAAAYKQEGVTVFVSPHIDKPGYEEGNIRYNKARNDAKDKGFVYQFLPLIVGVGPDGELLHAGGATDQSISNNIAEYVNKFNQLQHNPSNSSVQDNTGEVVFPVETPPIVESRVSNTVPTLPHIDPGLLSPADTPLETFDIKKDFREILRSDDSPYRYVGPNHPVQKKRVDEIQRTISSYTAKNKTTPIESGSYIYTDRSGQMLGPIKQELHLDQYIRPHAEILGKEFQENGLGNLILRRGFISREEQDYLHKTFGKDGSVAQAGKSQHQKPMPAIDIENLKEKNDGKDLYGETYQFMIQNSARLGWTRPFARPKDPTTGLYPDGQKPDRSHWLQVGEAVATFLADNDITRPQLINILMGDENAPASLTIPSEVETEMKKLLAYKDPNYVAPATQDISANLPSEVIPPASNTGETIRNYSYESLFDQYSARTPATAPGVESRPIKESLSKSLSVGGDVVTSYAHDVVDPSGDIKMIFQDGYFYLIDIKQKKMGGVLVPDALKRLQPGVFEAKTKVGEQFITVKGSIDDGYMKINQYDISS